MDNRLAVTATTAAPRVRVLRWRRSVPLRWSLAPDGSAAIGLLAASLIFYYPLVFLTTFNGTFHETGGGLYAIAVQSPVWVRVLAPGFGALAAWYEAQRPGRLTHRSAPHR